MEITDLSGVLSTGLLGICAYFLRELHVKFKALNESVVQIRIHEEATKVKIASLEDRLDKLEQK